MVKKRNALVAIARSELSKNNRERFIVYLFFCIFLLAFFILLLFLLFQFFEIIGFASIDSRAGYITSVQLHSYNDAIMWGGIYGLVLRVPDFTQQLFVDLPSTSVKRSDVFFDCIQTDAQGGPEFYASTASGLTISAANTVPASTQMVDDVLGCSGEDYCADRTFTQNMSIYIGEDLIENIPSTYTFKYTGQRDIFDIGILNISNNLVFVSHINASIQKGYHPDYIVNYQMLLPVPQNSTHTYYFYADPNDVCPSGGIGSSINATVYGYALDDSGNPLEDVSINFVGYNTLSNASGFFNISSLVLEGTFKLLGQKEGYNVGIRDVIINSSSYVLYRNITLNLSQTTSSNLLNPLVFGYVVGTNGVGIEDVNVSFGNETTTTNSSGRYAFNPSLVPGEQPIVASKQDYDNYYYLINVSSWDSEINHNITLELANLNIFSSGPFTDQKTDDKEGDSKEKAKSEAEEAGQDYWVSTQEINKQVRFNTFVEDSIGIYNFKQGSMQVFFTVSSDIADIVDLSEDAINIGPDSFGSVTLTISGTKPFGIYRGVVALSGDINAEIPVKIEVVPRSLPVESLDMQIELFDNIIPIRNDLKYKLHLQNFLTDQPYQIGLKYLILNTNGTKVLYEDYETVEIVHSLTLLGDIPMPENFSEGNYLFSVEASYLDLFSSATAPFVIYRPIYLYSFFGIPLWIIFIIIGLLSFILFNFFMYKHYSQKKKRYHLALDLNTLPKPGERSIKLGFLAERKVPAYYDMDAFTTHGIVAGATGGGKSISAQVFVEEMLMKNIAVVVFDPTAQWSGMLRKNEDKKMMAFYTKFGLKPSDSKAFAGNVRQVTNYKESIDINKYINPGQIQIFTLNKLDPKQIDIFVAGVINNIFKSDPKEYPNLRVLLVFDEVHRLLPKFGGSGKGFLQIERACREFRKWGFGVMLVSQVLSDFVGEIKANINTEVQMRVAEENDLERIKERYGLDALKSLVRADVGTGMVQNAEYNRGRPYFVNFRPILHNTRRLSDEVLEKYNKYNEVIEDLEYQVEQLEKEKVDVFDLKMEIKLVKNKLMTGNFTVVDIYLEGLGPRIKKQWESAGKQPKKKELELIDESELESSLKAAQKDRDKWAKEKGGGEEKKEEVKEEKVDEKIVAPITFDNGMMVSSLKELKDVLPNLDDSVFKLVVNEQKNDIADWIANNIDKSLGEKIKSAKDKQSMIKTLESFGKEGKEEDKKTDKKEDKKEEGKKEEVDSKKEEKVKEPINEGEKDEKSK